MERGKEGRSERQLCVGCVGCCSGDLLFNPSLEEALSLEIVGDG